MSIANFTNSLPSRNDLPEWCQYVTQDQDGGLDAWSHKPVVLPSSGIWAGNSDFEGLHEYILNLRMSIENDEWIDAIAHISEIPEEPTSPHIIKFRQRADKIVREQGVPEWCNFITQDSDGRIDGWQIPPRTGVLGWLNRGPGDNHVTFQRPDDANIRNPMWEQCILHKGSFKIEQHVESSENNFDLDVHVQVSLDFVKKAVLDALKDTMIVDSSVEDVSIDEHGARIQIPKS